MVDTGNQSLAYKEVNIPSTGDVAIEGSLAIPEDARGMILLAHGSSSSRMSPRNRYVARVLQEAGFGTLIVDLLSPEEALDRRNVFDIGLLTSRVADATAWLTAFKGTKDLPLAYYGSSTGASAMLRVAAKEDAPVHSVVCRSGRPDLVSIFLPRVRAATLLIVGGNDDLVLELNQDAYELLRCVRRLHIVPDASHLFQELGALEEAVSQAQRWFDRHMPKSFSRAA